MAKIADLSSMTYEEALKYLVEVILLPEDYAKFMLALGEGNIAGDLIEEQDDGE